jgi:hypothetical protein
MHAQREYFPEDNDFYILRDEIIISAKYLINFPSE